MSIECLLFGTMPGPCFDHVGTMTMTFNLLFTLTESTAYPENSVQVTEVVPGWGGGCPAENKDQLKFELIKI